MFRNRGFNFTKTVVYTVMVQFIYMHQYKQSCR